MIVTYGSVIWTKYFSLSGCWVEKAQLLACTFELLAVSIDEV